MNELELTIYEQRFLEAAFEPDVPDQTISPHTFTQILKALDGGIGLGLMVFHQYGLSIQQRDHCSINTLRAVLIGMATNIPACAYDTFNKSNFSKLFLNGQGQAGLIARLSPLFVSRTQARKAVMDEHNKQNRSLRWIPARADYAINNKKKKKMRQMRRLTKAVCASIDNSIDTGLRSLPHYLAGTFRNFAETLLCNCENSGLADFMHVRKFASDLQIFFEYKNLKKFCLDNQLIDVYRLNCMKAIQDHHTIIEAQSHYKVATQTLFARRLFSHLLVKNDKKAIFREIAIKKEQLLSTAHFLKGYSSARITPGTVHPIPTMKGVEYYQCHALVHAHGQDIKIFTPINAKSGPPLLIIAARGTKDYLSGKLNLDGKGPNNGFIQANKKNILQGINNAIQSYRNAAGLANGEKIDLLVTGHSLGGSTAELLATAIQEGLVFNELRRACISSNDIIQHLNGIPDESIQNIASITLKRHQKNKIKLFGGNYDELSNINELNVVSRCSARICKHNAQVAAGMSSLLKTHNRHLRQNVIIDANFGDLVTECAQSNYGRYMNKAIANICYIRNVSNIFKDDFIIAHTRDKIVGFSEHEKRSIDVHVYSNTSEDSSGALDTVLQYSRKAMRFLMRLNHKFNPYTSLVSRANINTDFSAVYVSPQRGIVSNQNGQTEQFDSVMDTIVVAAIADPTIYK